MEMYVSISPLQIVALIFAVISLVLWRKSFEKGKTPSEEKRMNSMAKKASLMAFGFVDLLFLIGLFS